MTSVRVLTPSGRGAVATLLVRGDLGLIDESPPLFQSAQSHPVATLPIGRVSFGRWGDSPGEEVVVCRTGESELEIHCHGGAAAAARMIGDLTARGCELSPTTEGDPNGEDLLERECLDALSRATTLRTADILLQQQSGVLRDAFERLEAGDVRAATREVDGLLRWAEFGIHLTRPWRVVLCGRPNVGKSSLINALLGFSRAIVFDQPGTTRDVVSAETALEGWPIVLSDTAGLRENADELETAGIERARRTIAEADLRIVLLDTSQPPHTDDWRLLEIWSDALIVGHKCDLPSAWGDALPRGALSVSSLTRSGVDQLAEEIVRRLVPEVPPPMTPVPVTPRQVDLLREIRPLLAAEDAEENVRSLIATLIRG